MLRRKHGFTLIELLVVISIIALLIGILLPALGKARVAATRAVNQSNQRQLMIGIHSYAADQNGFAQIRGGVSDGNTAAADIAGPTIFGPFSGVPGDDNNPNGWGAIGHGETMGIGSLFPAGQHANVNPLVRNEFGDYATLDVAFAPWDQQATMMIWDITAGASPAPIGPHNSNWSLRAWFGEQYGGTGWVPAEGTPPPPRTAANVIWGLSGANANGANAVYRSSYAYRGPDYAWYDDVSGTIKVSHSGTGAWTGTPTQDERIALWQNSQTESSNWGGKAVLMNYSSNELWTDQGDPQQPSVSYALGDGSVHTEASGEFFSLATPNELVGGSAATGWPGTDYDLHASIDPAAYGVTADSGNTPHYSDEFALLNYVNDR